MTKPGNRPETPPDGPEGPGAERRREAVNGRARRAERAARAVLDDGPISRYTERGEVTVTEVDVRTEDGLDYLNVRCEPGEAGETHFRIFNVPTGVRRPDGTVEEDPIGALVEVLALHGAAVPTKRRLR
jgi:hypothetical protein